MIALDPGMVALDHGMVYHAIALDRGDMRFNIG